MEATWAKANFTRDIRTGGACTSESEYEEIPSVHSARHNAHRIGDMHLFRMEKYGSACVSMGRQDWSELITCSTRSVTSLVYSALVS